MTDGHIILVVEDEDADAIPFIERLEDWGYECIRARSQEEAFVLLETKRFCCACVDLEIPRKRGLPARPEAGHRVIEVLRGRHPIFDSVMRCHLLPIIAVSGHANDPVHLDTAFREGIDRRIVKPVVHSIPPMKAVLDDVFAKSGRANHADCERRTIESRAPAITEPRRVLTISGKADGQRRLAHLGETPIGLQKDPFCMVVGMALGQALSADGWVDKGRAGCPEEKDSWPGPKRLKEDLTRAGLDPDAFYENQRGKKYRFRRGITVNWAAVDLDRLDKDDDERVESAAKEIRRLIRRP